MSAHETIIGPRLLTDRPHRRHIRLGAVGFAVIGVLLSLGCGQGESNSGEVPPDAFPPGASDPGEVPPNVFPLKFHVEGNRIVDENGNDAVLRGLTPVDPVTLNTETEAGSSRFLLWDEEIFSTMSAWGADIVRLPIGPYNWRNKGEDKVFEVIDQAIEWASNYELYVYIDFHGIGFPPTEEYQGRQWSQTSREEVLGFWDRTSQHYKDNEIVAFYELFNEPTFSGSWPPTSESLADDWPDWKEFVEQVVDVIRINDPDSVIMVGGLVWAHDISFAREDPIDRDNIIYATHPYPGTMWYPISWEEAFGETASEYPVFVTEFGAGVKTLLKVHEVQQYIRQHIDVDRYEDALEACECTGCECDREQRQQLYQEFLDEVWANPETSTYLSEMLTKYKTDIRSMLDEKKLGWSAWIFDFEWGNDLVSDRRFTPTEVGLFFRDWLSDTG